MASACRRCTPYSRMYAISSRISKSQAICKNRRVSAAGLNHGHDDYMRSHFVTSFTSQRCHHTQAADSDTGRPSHHHASNNSLSPSCIDTQYKQTKGPPTTNASLDMQNTFTSFHVHQQSYRHHPPPFALTNAGINRNFCIPLSTSTLRSKLSTSLSFTGSPAAPFNTSGNQTDIRSYMGRENSLQDSPIEWSIPALPPQSQAHPLSTPATSILDDVNLGQTVTQHAIPRLKLPHEIRLAESEQGESLMKATMVPLHDRSRQGSELYSDPFASEFGLALDHESFISSSDLFDTNFVELEEPHQGGVEPLSANQSNGAPRVLQYEFEQSNRASFEHISASQCKVPHPEWEVAFPLSADEMDIAFAPRFTTGPFMPTWPPEDVKIVVAETESNFPELSTGNFHSSDLFSSPNSAPVAPVSTHDPASQRDRSRDQLLLECRNKNMSYKDIKQRYGFTEAESTLRGRWRTLTKPKGARVRKPGWSPRDVKVLCYYVHSLALKEGVSTSAFKRIDGLQLLATDRDLKKVLWKLVAHRMHSLGNTYKYGNATVKKKYLEVRQQKLQPAG